MADKTYDNIQNPYSIQLLRSDNTPAMNDITDIEQNEGGRTIKSGSTLTDAWIDTWIKSSNYSPKKKGFFLDALNGYIETMKFSIGTGIDMYGNDAYFYDFSTGGKGIATVSISSGGLGYSVGNVLTVIQSGAAGGQITVSSINPANGEITGAVVTAGGAGYIVQIDNPVIGGSGNGATFNVLTITAAGSISGDTSSIVFQRAFYPDQEFLIQKRIGMNSSSDSTADNVMEFFYPNAPQTGRRNYLFLGLKGNSLSGLTDFNTNVIGIVSKDLIQIYSGAGNSHYGVWPFVAVELNIISYSATSLSLAVPDTGGSWINIGAIDSTVSADYNPYAASGGGGMTFGVYMAGGYNISLWLDRRGAWLANPLLPDADNNFPLGDLTHNFSEIHIYPTGGLYLGSKKLTNQAGVLTWDGTPVGGGTSYGPFITTADGTSGGTVYGKMDADIINLRFQVYSVGRDMVIGATSYTTFVQGASISPINNGVGSCGLSSRFWANVFSFNYTLDSSPGAYINWSSNHIRFNAQTQTQGSIFATGDLYAGSTGSGGGTGGSVITGSSTGTIVNRGRTFYSQSITYKDGAGVSQTKWFLVA